MLDNSLAAKVFNIDEPMPLHLCLNYRGFGSKQAGSRGNHQYKQQQ
jgi:hypothetical protein